MFSSAVAVRIALVGDGNSSYPSHQELHAVDPLLGDDVELRWVATAGPEIGDLSGFDAVWLAPSSPYSSDANVYDVIGRARENDVPFLGGCGGLQYAVLEFFRRALGITAATRAEVDGAHESNVVTALSRSLFGERRESVQSPALGSRPWSTTVLSRACTTATTGGMDGPSALAGVPLRWVTC